jgi:hypothetical protein
MGYTQQFKLLLLLLLLLLLCFSLLLQFSQHTCSLQLLSITAMHAVPHYCCTYSHSTLQPQLSHTLQHNREVHAPFPLLAMQPMQ